MRWQKRLSTKYALYFAALLTLIMSLTLGLAGYFSYAGTQELRRDLAASFSSIHTNNTMATLRASGHYLSNRLFNPLFDLDISRLNDEIEQIRTWLHPVEIQILDRDAKVVTDGTAGNPDYGRVYWLPGGLEPGKPAIEAGAQQASMYFAIGYESQIIGFARIVFSNARDRALIESLEQKVKTLAQGFSRELLITTLIASALIALATMILGWRLSVSLSRPLRAMSQAAEQVAAGERRLNLRGGQDDELGRLAIALNRMAADLAHAERLLTRAQDIAAFGSWEWRRGHDALKLSSGAYPIFGSESGAMDTRLASLLERFLPSDRERASLLLQGRNNPSDETELRITRSDGEERTILIKGETTLDAEGQPVHCIGTFQDVTEAQQARQQLMMLANYDTLTQLPNRHLFFDRLHQAIAKARRCRAQVALLFFDLDRFKAVNDALGHEVGDELLRLVAGRLRSLVREVDTLARMGGDEFTLIVDDIQSERPARLTAERMLAAFEKGFLVANRELFISVSIGIALFPRDGETPKLLLKNADSAMYAAKENGKSQFRFFTQELDRLAHERLTIEHDIRHAVAHDELSLVFQPQVRTADGTLAGFEALLRWRGSGRDEVSPALFVPILEEIGLMRQLTAKVLIQACDALVELQQQAHSRLRMAINLSARQFQDPGLMALIGDALRRTGLKPGHLEIEITESTLLDHEQSERNAQALAERGIRLAIDDFGTGYSSLSYLKRLDVDTLKIDKSFIAHLLDDPEDAQIVSAVLGLARGLRIESVAEGVEDARQTERLREMGCDLVQGFQIAHPQPLAASLDWVAADAARRDH